MKQIYLSIIDDVKKRIEEQVVAALGETMQARPNKTVYFEQGSFDEDPYLVPFKLMRVFVENGSVLIRIKDRDGDIDECYLRDCSLGDIQEVLSAI